MLTYSPKDINITIAGLHSVSGYVDGTFIKIIKDVTPFKMAKAMDGEVVRLAQEDSTYTVELTVAQSSQTNSVLTSLWNIDSALNVGKFPVLVNDANGQTSFFSGIAWVEQAPDVTFGTGVEPRTWKLRCTYASMIIGGAGSASLIESAIQMGAAFLPILKEFGVF